MLEVQSVSDISSHCLGYHISDIVSGIRKAFRICYDVLPFSLALSPRRYGHQLVCLLINHVISVV